MTFCDMRNPTVSSQDGAGGRLGKKKKSVCTDDIIPLHHEMKITVGHATRNELRNEQYPGTLLIGVQGVEDVFFFNRCTSMVGLLQLQSHVRNS